MHLFMLKSNLNQISGV